MMVLCGMSSGAIQRVLETPGIPPPLCPLSYIMLVLSGIAPLQPGRIRVLVIKFILISSERAIGKLVRSKNH